MPMDIIKRNGSTEPYERAKIARVIERAFASVESTIAAEKLNAMVDTIEQALEEEVRLGLASKASSSTARTASASAAPAA